MVTGANEGIGHHIAKDLVALRDTAIKLNAACPGSTKTAINNFRGTRSVEKSAREAMRLALIRANGSTGAVSDEDGPVAR